MKLSFFTFLSNIFKLGSKKTKIIYEMMDLVSRVCLTWTLEVSVQFQVSMWMLYQSYTNTLGMYKYLGFIGFNWNGSFTGKLDQNRGISINPVKTGKNQYLTCWIHH